MDGQSAKAGGRTGLLIVVGFHPSWLLIRMVKPEHANRVDGHGLLTFDSYGFAMRCLSHIFCHAGIRIG